MQQIVIAFLFLIVFSACSSTTDIEMAKAVRYEQDYSQSAYYNTSYGMQPFGSFLRKKVVQDGEYVADIFSREGVSMQDVFAISELSDSVFNERRVKVGNKYAFLYDMENGELKAEQFIYEKNKVDYVVIDLDDITGYVYQKPIDTVERMTTGLITSSLYQTMEDENVNPHLAVKLSEIYAWTIDFYRIQENDYFKVIYQEEFVEGESLGEFRIHACLFNHFGKDQYAFQYDSPNDTLGIFKQYYDEEGNSLKNAFLQAPVKFTRISSKYTMNRYHPVTGQHKPHLGTDYAAPAGTPIYSTADGVITHATYTQYNGNYVKVKHNSVYTTQYLHMSKIADGMAPGVAVAQGEVIGYVGQTGLATGPHVCYRFWKNGQQVDPYAQDLPSSEPLDSVLIDDYLTFIEDHKTHIDSLKIFND
ncbi:MAG: peptidoglycan DD-metalloendopeptidase family protein [Chitinophagales bacterium]